MGTVLRIIAQTRLCVWTPDAEGAAVPGLGAQLSDHHVSHIPRHRTS